MHGNSTYKNPLYRNPPSMLKLVHYKARMVSKRFARYWNTFILFWNVSIFWICKSNFILACISYEPFPSSDLIFNNYNHTRCLPHEKTSRQLETMTTLTVNPDCVSSDKVSVFLLRWALRIFFVCAKECVWQELVLKFQVYKWYHWCLKYYSMVVSYWGDDTTL